jgi:DNA-binding CsgD family transcriptional regulator
LLEFFRSVNQGSKRQLEARFRLAVILDGTGELIAIDPGFAKEIGVDPEKCIGQAQLFSWCGAAQSQICSNRLKQLTALDVTCISWECCYSSAGSPPQGNGCESGANGNGDNTRTLCLAVSDPTLLKEVDFDPHAAVDRVRDLEAATNRIRLEIEQLALPTHAPLAAVNAEVGRNLKLLSAREWEVLQLLMDRCRVPNIAKQLCISPHTVRNHLQSIFRKVEVRSQSELIEKLRDWPFARLTTLSRSEGRDPDLGRSQTSL